MTEHTISRRTCLAIALVVALGASAIPNSRFMHQLWQDHLGGEEAIPFNLLTDLVLLGIGLVLCLSAPAQSGIRFGSLWPHRYRVLAVCTIPIVVAAIEYSNMPEKPFADDHWSMWVFSPLAHNLVYIGFLNGWLGRSFPGLVHPRIPVQTSLVLTALFYALTNLSSLLVLPGGFFVIHVAVGSLGLVFVGLSRQWTGSILYATLSDSAAYYIAWESSAH